MKKAAWASVALSFMSTSTRFTQFLSGLAVTSLLLLSSAQAGPLGNPFRVNASPAGNQGLLEVSTGANGDILVLWGDTTSGYAIFLQRYDSSGRALQADPWYLGSGALYAAALDRNGNFVLVRESADGSGNGIYATLYDRAGHVRVSEFRVNDTTAGEQYNQLVAMNANGDFAVAWSSTASGTDAVYVKRFGSNGTAVSPQTLASDPAYHQQVPMEIGIDGLGNFAVTWHTSRWNCCGARACCQLRTKYVGIPP